MPDLLQCIVCGGKVSSDADTCPHCGTKNYKSLARIKQESDDLQAKLSSKGEKVSLSWHDKSYECCCDESWFIDDTPLLSFCSSSESSTGTVLRIKKGRHVLKLVCSYANYSYGRREIIERISTRDFSIYGPSKMIIECSGVKDIIHKIGSDDYKRISNVTVYELKSKTNCDNN